MLKPLWNHQSLPTIRYYYTLSSSPTNHSKFPQTHNHIYLVVFPLFFHRFSTPRDSFIRPIPGPHRPFGDATLRAAREDRARLRAHGHAPYLHRGSQLRRTSVASRTTHFFWGENMVKRMLKQWKDHENMTDLGCLASMISTRGWFMCCNDHHGCIMHLSPDIILIRSSNPPVARNQTISSNEFLPAFSSPVVTSKAQQARLFHLNGTFVHEPWPGQGHLVPAWSAYGMFIEIFLWPPRQSLDCKSMQISYFWWFDMVRYFCS